MIPPGANQFPAGGNCVKVFPIVLYDKFFFVFRRETALLCHGGSRMIKSNRDVLRVYVVNADDAEGNVSSIKADRAGM